MFVTMKLTKRLAVFGVIFGVCISILGFAGAKAGMSIAASAQAEEGVTLPIIMYHSILKDPAMQGDYVISPELFEQDLQYLQANGYTGISMQDLLDYVNQGTPLPEKPVLLTFDDGYYNNYFYAYPLAKQYDFKMIISPVGMLTEKFSNTEDVSPYYSHITWDNIQEMLASGIVEFQNHTYNLHTNDGGRKGAKKKSGESVEQYQQMLREDVGKMQDVMKEHTGIAPTTFVYPFGAVSKEAMPVLKELGFQATLICESKMNTITQDPECLFGLGRYLRPAHISSESYFAKLGM
ncbi:MAG: polysaccharide deacetylase family protein [Clostridiales bacterium]|nr:polysaccharide deacetylase family protein [Clostridiales bacterium]